MQRRAASCSVRDERGKVYGKAFYSSKSQIALRFLDAKTMLKSTSNFSASDSNQADQLRERLGVDPMLSRRIYSEGDLLPGLIVDRYNDCLVVQSLIQATDAHSTSSYLACSSERYHRAPFFSEMIAGCESWKGWN